MGLPDHVLDAPALDAAVIDGRHQRSARSRDAVVEALLSSTTTGTCAPAWPIRTSRRVAELGVPPPDVDELVRNDRPSVDRLREHFTAARRWVTRTTSVVAQRIRLYDIAGPALGRLACSLPTAPPCGRPSPSDVNSARAGRGPFAAELAAPSSLRRTTSALKRRHFSGQALRRPRAGKHTTDVLTPPSRVVVMTEAPSPDDRRRRLVTPGAVDRLCPACSRRGHTSWSARSKIPCRELAALGIGRDRCRGRALTDPGPPPTGCCRTRAIRPNRRAGGVSSPARSGVRLQDLAHAVSGVSKRRTTSQGGGGPDGRTRRQAGVVITSAAGARPTDGAALLAARAAANMLVTTSPPKCGQGRAGQPSEPSWIPDFRPPAPTIRRCAPVSRWCRASPRHHGGVRLMCCRSSTAPEPVRHRSVVACAGGWTEPNRGHAPLQAEVAPIGKRPRSARRWRPGPAPR